METRQTVELNQVDQRLEVTQSCLLGSAFNDVNLSESSFVNVNLSNAKVIITLTNPHPPKVRPESAPTR
jgi:hypothetical protein